MGCKVELFKSIIEDLEEEKKSLEDQIQKFDDNIRKEIKLEVELSVDDPIRLFENHKYNIKNLLRQQHSAIIKLRAVKEELFSAHCHAGIF